MPQLTRPLVLLLFLLVVVLLPACTTQKHLRSGRDALNVGDPITARHHFEEALLRKPRLANNATFAAELRLARRDAAHLEGDRALRVKRYDRAIEHLTLALKLDPSLDAARTSLQAAHHGAAEVAYARAVAAADAGQREKTNDNLRTALRHQPDHPQAALAQASLDDPAPPPAFRDATTDRAAGNWEAAAEHYANCAAEHPTFFPARLGRHTLPGAAAAALLDDAKERTDRGDFTKAAAQLKRAAHFVPDHPRLPNAHAELHAAHARKLQAAGRPGAALLAARAALAVDGHPPTADQRDLVNELTQTLRDQHPDTVRLLGGDTAPDLYQRLTDRIIRHDTAAVYLEASRVAGPTDPAVPTWTLTADAPRFDANRITRVNKKHAYKVHYTVPNPKIPELQHELGDLSSKLFGLTGRELGLASALHAAQCRRDAWVRPQKRKDHNDAKDSKKKNRQKSNGSEKNPYDHEVSAARSRLSSLQSKISRISSRQSQVHHELDREPAQIPAVRTEYHPWVEVTHHQHAQQRARLTPPDPTDASTSSDPTVFTAQATVAHADATREGARPDLGLKHDPLDLLSESQLAERLRQSLAKKLARQLIHHRIETRRHALLATNTPESRVAAAVLLAAISKKQSEADLNAEPLPSFTP